MNLVSNYSECNFVERIKELHRSSNIFIASPYFTENEFLNLLLNSKGNIKLLVKLCPSTSIEALEKVLTSDKFDVRYCCNDKFHSKIYNFDNEVFFVGSSNFTFGGLNKNIELNIEITNKEYDINVLKDICDYYWDDSYELSYDVLTEYRKFLIEHKKSISEAKKIDEQSTDLLNKFEEVKANKRKLSEEHKRKISESNLGKNRGKLTEERKEALVRGAKKALSQAVICINDGTKYSSMVEASHERYGTKRKNGYVSKVCNGKMLHYRNDVFRFLTTYEKMSADEINLIHREIEMRAAPKIEKKSKTIVRYLGIDFDCLEEVGYRLKADGFERAESYGHNISALIGQAKKKECPFVRISKLSGDGFYYLFYSEYDYIYEDNKLIDTKAVNVKIEEIEDFYYEHLDSIIGDITVSDLLNSSKTTFYKYNNQYFKSKKSISEKYIIDRELSRMETIKLIDKGYKSSWNYSLDEMLKSNKKTFYLFGDIIYWSKTEHIDNNCIKISKNDILEELNLKM